MIRNPILAAMGYHHVNKNWGQTRRLASTSPAALMAEIHIFIDRKVDCVGSPKNPWMPMPSPILGGITQLSSMFFHLTSGYLTWRTGKSPFL
jgi:hypothetical protein